MNKTFTRVKIVFLLMAVLLSQCVHVYAAAEVLTTDHFIINYNINNSACALAMASKLESYNDMVTSFLEFDPPDKINIYISGKENKNNFINNDFGNRNSIYINTGGNFSPADDRLYDKFFLIYLHKLTNDGKGLPEIDKSLVRALMLYPEREHQFIEVIRRDLVDNVKITSVDFKELKKKSNDEQLAIYTVLIDFIISDYGKKKLVQSLKDTDYYGGFFEALSKITGDPITAISEKFNIFLNNRNSAIPELNAERKQLHPDEGRYTDISYSISGEGQAALLQRDDNRFRILLKNSDESSIVKLKQYESGSSFSDLVFISNEQIAVAEIIETGSVIHIYDIKKDRYLNDLLIPFLFISDINLSVEGSVIFSAACGLTSDIYTLNTVSGELNILTDSGSNFSPVMFNDKVYFIFRTDRNNIVELNPVTGVMKTLFSTEQKISGLNCSDDKTVIFALKINGLENIFTYDLLNGSLRRMFKDSNSNLSPEISGKYIYFLTFYKNRYKVFYNTLNPADF